MIPKLGPVINKYRHDGMGGLLSSGQAMVLNRVYKHLYSSTGSEFHYQLAKRDGVEERWKMVKPFLDEGNSLLDVGCNAGLMTKKASDHNIFSVGIDKNQATISDAVSYHGGSQDFGLIHRSITPYNIDEFPMFDYVFLFSIYHHLYREQGSDSGTAIINELSKKTNNRLFFESASRKEEYGDMDLPFKDQDERSIVNYNTEMLEEVIDKECTIDYIGSRSKGTSGERFLFVATMEPV